jgi:hypothetical protein
MHYVYNDAIIGQTIVLVSNENQHFYHYGNAVVNLTVLALLCISYYSEGVDSQICITFCQFR